MLPRCGGTGLVAAQPMSHHRRVASASTTERDVSNANEILIDGSRFWVVYRGRAFGPFDYEWSKDFAGIEMTFRGIKFGEYVSRQEIFADLKEFELPGPVVNVATIAIGSIVSGVLEGLPEAERSLKLAERLSAMGFGRFVLSVGSVAEEETER